MTRQKPKSKPKTAPKQKPVPKKEKKERNMTQRQYAHTDFIKVCMEDKNLKGTSRDIVNEGLRECNKNWKGETRMG